jgi:predicted metal-dependent hydrolase
MIKEISINDNLLRVNIKSVKRSKNIKILVYTSGKIVLTKPSYISLQKAYDFLESRKKWIESTLSKYNIKFPINFEEVKIKEEKHYKQYRYKAKQIITERVAEINKYYNYKYGRISVRNQRTRWGSCSREGNLNFNYRLIFLEQEAFDYIICHELCHLKEFNHSPKFWLLVAKVCPDYKYWRKKLKDNSNFSLE